MISAVESSPSPSSISKITTPKHLLSEVASRSVKVSQNVVIATIHRISARAACGLVARRKCPPHPEAPFATVLVGSLVRVAKVVSDDVPVRCCTARRDNSLMESDSQQRHAYEPEFRC